MGGGMKKQDEDLEWQERLEANRRQLDRIAAALEEEAGLRRPLSESVGDIITRDYEDADFAQALTDRETLGYEVVWKLPAAATVAPAHAGRHVAPRP